MIYEGASSGADVQALIDTKLMPALQGVDLDLAVGAMCCMIMVQMCPTMTTEQLYEGVRGISGWLCTYVAGLDATTPAVVN